jgi:hypothetical protein
VTVLPIITVNTKHSSYVIDQNAGTYTRTRVHPDANDLSYGGINDAEPVAYDDIVAELVVGGIVVITHGDGSWVRSTPIVSIGESA